MFNVYHYLCKGGSYVIMHAQTGVLVSLFIKWDCLDLEDIHLVLQQQ